MTPRMNRQQSVAVIIAAGFVLFILRIVVSTAAVADVVAPLGRLGSWARFDSSEIQPDSALEQSSELAVENSQLRAELDLPIREVKDSIKADVLTKSVQSYRQVLRINRGTDDGVFVDSAVLSNAQVIGRVTEASSDTALVLLLNDPEFRAAAVITGTDAEGVLQNEAGGLVLDTVNRIDEEVVKKTIVTSGLGGIFPPGLPLGVVGSELSEDTEIFARYVVNRNQSLGSLRVVDVLIKDSL